MNQKNMVKGIPEVTEMEEVYSDCVAGIQHRETMPKKSNWSASRRHESILADICGLIKPESNNKKRYF